MKPHIKLLVLAATVAGLFGCDSSPSASTESSKSSSSDSLQNGQTGDDITGGALDSNDGVSRAAPLNIGSKLSDIPAEDRDVDWFRFQADSGKVYTLSYPTWLYGSVWTADSQQVSEELAGLLIVPIDYLNRDPGYAGQVLVCKKSGTYELRLEANSAGMYWVELQVGTALPAWYVAPDKFEPDNGLSNASVFAPDTIAAIHTLSSGDEDWTRVDLDPGRTYFVEVKNNGTGECRFSLFNADSELVIPAVSVQSNFTSRYEYKVSQKTSIHLRVFGDSRYALRVWPAPLDSFESDDGISTAKTLPVDGVAQTRTLQGDDDWIKVRFDSVEPYFFRLDNPGSGGTIHMEIYGADSVKAPGGGVQSATWSNYLTRSFTPTVPGDHYVHLYTDASDRSDCLPYSISVALQPKDVHEVNNTLSQATPIAVDGTVQTHMLTSGDPDFIRFDVDSGVRYSMTLATKEIGKDIKVTILSPESTIVCNAQTTATSTTISNTANHRTTWYIKVESASLQTTPFNYEVNVKAATVVGSQPTLVEGNVLLQPDGIRKQMIFQDQKQAELQFEAEAGSDYGIRLKADTEFGYKLFGADSTTCLKEGRVVPSYGLYLGIPAGYVDELYRVVLTFPADSRVAFDATLTHE